MKRNIIPVVLSAALISLMTVKASAAPYLTDTSVTIGVGDTADVRLEDYEGKAVWKISDGSIISYRSGVITGLSEGKATLTVTNKGNSYVCSVTVSGTASSKDSSEGSIWSTAYTADNVISVGQAKTLYISIDAGNVVVKYDNPAAVSLKCGIYEDGTFPLTVTGLSNGLTTITVYDKDDPSVSRTFTVKVVSDGAAEKAPEKSYEDQLIDLVNNERAAHGLDLLEKDDALMDCASTRAKELAVKFSHTRPNGDNALDMITWDVTTAGENIAKGYSTPKGAFKGWMSSTGHRANMLSTEFGHIGVGYDSKSGSWVQIFTD